MVNKYSTVTSGGGRRTKEEKNLQLGAEPSKDYSRVTLHAD